MATPPEFPPRAFDSARATSLALADAYGSACDAHDKLAEALKLNTDPMLRGEILQLLRSHTAIRDALGEIRSSTTRTE